MQQSQRILIMVKSRDCGNLQQVSIRPLFEQNKPFRLSFAQIVHILDSIFNFWTTDSGRCIDVTTIKSVSIKNL